MPNVVQELIDAENDLVLSRHTLNAALVIMVYDWLLTLSTEKRLVWPARWSIVKTIFLVNRYLIPWNLVFAIYGWSGKALWFKPLSCTIWITTDTCILLAFFAGLHFIVSLRAWALYERRRSIGFLLWGAYGLYLISTASLSLKAMLSIPAVLQPFINICFGKLPSYLALIWLPSIIFESFVFLLTAFKAYSHSHRKIENPILTVLYRDGFLYFVFISLSSITNLVFWSTTSPTKVILIKYISAALSQVAGSHLVLDLLAIGHKTGHSVLSDHEHKHSLKGPSNNRNTAYELAKFPPAAAPRVLTARTPGATIEITSGSHGDMERLGYGFTHSHPYAQETTSWSSPDNWNSKRASTASPLGESDSDIELEAYGSISPHSKRAPTPSRGIHWLDRSQAPR